MKRLVRFWSVCILFRSSAPLRWASNEQLTLSAVRLPTITRTRRPQQLMYLHGWTRSALCISSLALSWEHGTSFLPGVVLRSGSAVFYSHRRPVCPRLSCGSGEALRLSRVAHLRGGGKSSTVYVADGSNESAGARGISGVVDELSSTEEAAATAAGAAKKRWLLGASEHDGQISGLALPALMSLLVDPILSLVDTAYVGRGLGAISLAALGPCTSIFHFSFNTFRSLTQSTTALVGQSIAAGDEEEAGQIVQQMYVIACVLGVGLQVALLTQAPAILALMGAGPSTALFKEASGYLKVRALAAPAVLLIMVSEGVFRGHANTGAPAVAALSAAGANIILDPIFMFVLSMGVAGAAGATAVAQYLAVAIYGVMLWRGARTADGEGKRMAVPFFARGVRRRGAATGSDGGSVAAVGGGGGGAVRAKSTQSTWALLATVISANAAMLLRTTSLMSCWAVATAVAARMSSAAVGAHQVALSLWLLFALVAEAPSIAAQVLGARYIAQGKLETARSMARRVCTLTLLSSGILATGLLSLSGVIPRGFTSDPEVLRRLHRLLPLLALQQPLIAMTLVVEGLLVGARQFRWLGATTVCSSAVAAGLILMVGKRAPAWDILGIWAGITAMFVGRFLAAVWRVMDRKRGPYWVLPPTKSD